MMAPISDDAIDRVQGMPNGPPSHPYTDPPHGNPPMCAFSLGMDRDGVHTFCLRSAGHACHRTLAE